MSTISSWVKTSSHLDLAGKTCGFVFRDLLGFGGPGCFFFAVAPFCSCQASLVSRIFCCRPRVCKVFVFVVALRWAPRPFGGARAKKKHHPGCFFSLRPRGKAGEGEAPLGAGTGPEQKKKTHQKNTPGWCFFFCSGPVPAPNGACPSPAFPRSKKNTSPSLAFPGAGAKKSTLGGVFFFAAAPRGRSLAGVFFFFCCGRARTGVVFVFFCCGPARTLTHSLWAGAISARPRVVFFFCCGPAGSILDNNKQCLGYYIGSKKTGRGHSKKKKNTTSGLGLMGLQVVGLYIYI